MNRVSEAKPEISAVEQVEQEEFVGSAEMRALTVAEMDVVGGGCIILLT